jgi:hypothetical protein
MLRGRAQFRPRVDHNLSSAYPLTDAMTHRRTATRREASFPRHRTVSQWLARALAHHGYQGFRLGLAGIQAPSADRRMPMVPA